MSGLHSLPMIRSLKAALWLTAAMAFPVLTLSYTPMSAMWGMWLIAVIAPPLLMAAGLWGGLLPMLTGLAAMLALPFLGLDYRAGLLMALYLVPFTAMLMLVLAARVPYFRAAGLLCAVYLISAYTCLIVLQRVSGGNLYTVLADRVVYALTRSAYGDELLISLYQNRLITLDKDLLSKAQGLMGGLSALGRQELANSFRSRLADSFSGTPSLIMSYGIMLCFGCLALTIHVGRWFLRKKAYNISRSRQLSEAAARRQEALQRGEAPPRIRLESYSDFLSRMDPEERDHPLGLPDLGVPPFGQWHLPRAVGWMTAACAIGLLMERMGTSEAERTVGALLGAAFSAAFCLQGMAVMDFMHTRSGRGPAGRFFLTAALMVFFRLLFILLGVADQMMDFRRLRQPDPRGGE